jgi:hypothetical protein
MEGVEYTAEVTLKNVPQDYKSAELDFAKSALKGETKKTDAKVTIIEQKGKSDGNNPLGVKNE